MLRGFPSEILAYKTNFVDPSLPTFSLSFSWPNYFKHFSLSHRLDFFDWDIPFSSFFLSFLLDHVGEDFWIFLLLSIHEISWNCTILNWLFRCLCIFLLMGFDSFFHLNFLSEALLVKNFSLDSSESLGFFGDDFGFPSLFLPSLLFCV